jgi:hypothetical protein
MSYGALELFSVRGALFNDVSGSQLDKPISLRQTYNVGCDLTKGSPLLSTGSF